MQYYENIVYLMDESVCGLMTTYGLCGVDL